MKKKLEMDDNDENEEGSHTEGDRNDDANNDEETRDDKAAEKSKDHYGKQDSSKNVDKTAEKTSTSNPNNNSLQFGENDISALPITTLARSSAQVASIPGAFPVAGQNVNTVDEEMKDTSSFNNNNEEEEGIIEGAVLVTSGEELLVDEMETGDLILSTQEPTTSLPEEVFQGTVVTTNPRSRSSSRRARFFWLCIVAVLVIGVSAILLGVLMSPSASSHESAATTPNKDPIHFPPFLDTLSQAETELIMTVGSPAYLANRWMMLDPNFDQYSEQRKLQRFFMVASYHYLVGDGWVQKDDWLSYTVSECDWFSQTSEEEFQDWPVCNDNDELMVFALANNNLSGHFPAETAFASSALVPELRVLDVANNKLSGVAPVIHYPKLEAIMASNNNFTEMLQIILADGMSGTGTVRILKFDSNNLSLYFGGLMFPFMVNLEVYNVTGNHHTGFIAASISSCKNLTYVGMGHNNFESTLPTQLGLLTKLVELDVSGNVLLSGAVPSELGAIPTLTKVDVTETGLTGTIPLEICDRILAGNLHFSANCSRIECCK